MDKSNILNSRELISILGGDGHWEPIIDENGEIIGWEFIDDVSNSELN